MLAGRINPTAFVLCCWKGGRVACCSTNTDLANMPCPALPWRACSAQGGCRGKRNQRLLGRDRCMEAGRARSAADAFVLRLRMCAERARARLHLATMNGKAGKAKRQEAGPVNAGQKKNIAHTPD